MSVHPAGPGGRSGAATGADGAPAMLPASDAVARRFFPTEPLLRGSSRCATPGCVVLQRSIARDPSVLQRNIGGTVVLRWSSVGPTPSRRRFHSQAPLQTALRLSNHRSPKTKFLIRQLICSAVMSVSCRDGW